MDEKVYGIDLGTTNSAIAVYENDESKILKNIDGSESTPSVIFFTGVSNNGEDETLVGELAKNAAATDPNNVVQFVKRFMGKKGELYNHTAPSGNSYTPEMLSSIILKKVCKDAQEYNNGEEINNVVITVPAYFDDARRIATKQAGQIAGLNVLRVINEPTAAAIAFGIDTTKNGTVVVYDLGGGTFDVTVMKINNGNFDVIATDGDSQLGGINFDQKIISILNKRLAEDGNEFDDEDEALMADIREKAEKAKIQLTRVERTKIPFTMNGKTSRIEISREEFEQEAKTLLDRTEVVLNDVLNTAGLNWNQVDSLLMIGGSTKMPMVKKMLERISGKELSYKVDPDTAVARGAAVFASTLNINDSDLNSKNLFENPDNSNGSSGEQNGVSINVSDVTSQSLGVITIDTSKPGHRKQNTVIIPHNTKIPAKRSEEVFTMEDNQTNVLIEVTEGDDTNVDYVNVIGKSVLSIPRYPKGAPIEIIYSYDPDQTIYIEVIDKTANKSMGTFEIERQSNMDSNEVAVAASKINKISVD